MQKCLVGIDQPILLNHNKIYLSGDWRYYIFSQNNYGLGTDIIPSLKEDSEFVLESLAEPMNYDYFKFHQTVSFNIVSDFYVGAGIHLDGYANIVDKQLDVSNNCSSVIFILTHPRHARAWLPPLFKKERG